LRERACTSKSAEVLSPLTPVMSELSTTGDRPLDGGLAGKGIVSAPAGPLTASNTRQLVVTPASVGTDFILKQYTLVSPTPSGPQVLTGVQPWGIRGTVPHMRPLSRTIGQEPLDDSIRMNRRPSQRLACPEMAAAIQATGGAVRGPAFLLELPGLYPAGLSSIGGWPAHASGCITGSLEL
jgi:hypothetical protein